MAAEEGSVREMEEFLAGTGVFGGEEPPDTEETGEVVHDAPPDEQPAPAAPPAPPSQEKPVEEQPDEQEAEEEGEPHVVWATKKYGNDPDRWAKAAFDQERFISSLASEKKQAEDAARQAIEYAQQVEASAQTGPAGMPMSAAEEAWVDEAMANPTGYAYQAAMSGNAQLYNAVIQRVAEMDPGMAASVGTQVQLAMHQERSRLEAEQAAQQNGGGPQDFNADLGQSFQRVGVDIQRYGQSMWEKIDNLGEYHPYTLAILGGDPIQRDLAVQAVYDLVRTGQTTTSRVVDEQREAQIQREGELRRNAAGVVTGSPHAETTKRPPFFEAMEEEWRKRGQWPEEE